VAPEIFCGFFFASLLGPCRRAEIMAVISGAAKAQFITGG
jgi:hypothetical protein